MNTSTLSPLDVMNVWMQELDSSRTYSLTEELTCGDIVTHSTGMPHDELVRYVKAIWLDSHPAELIICPVA